MLTLDFSRVDAMLKNIWDQLQKNDYSTSVGLLQAFEDLLVLLQQVREQMFKGEEQDQARWLELNRRYELMYKYMYMRLPLDIELQPREAKVFLQLIPLREQLRQMLSPQSVKQKQQYLQSEKLKQQYLQSEPQKQLELQSELQKQLEKLMQQYLQSEKLK